MATEGEAPENLATQPHPALGRLAPLLGTWELRGRSLDSAEDNIFGRSTFAWLPGGHFMQVTGEIRVGDFALQSLEIIGYDPERDVFPSRVYTSMTGSDAAYEWEMRGDTVIHRGLGATYTGRFSVDGSTLSGGWRPDDGSAGSSGSAYDAVMVRVGGA